MGCEYVEIGGVPAIICSRGRGKVQKCIACSRPAAFQCDWKVGRVPAIRNGAQALEPKRCDAHLCAVHAREIAPEKHVCPVHSVTYDNWKRGRDAEANELHQAKR